jgi:hypothetical protein
MKRLANARSARSLTCAAHARSHESPAEKPTPKERKIVDERNEGKCCARTGAPPKLFRVARLQRAQRI